MVRSGNTQNMVNDSNFEWMDNILHWTVHCSNNGAQVSGLVVSVRLHTHTHTHTH